MNRRKIALLLVFMILLQLAPFMPHEIVSAGTYTTATNYYDGTYSTRSFSATEWTQLQLDYNIPSNVAKQNTKGIPFNIELWNEKGIVVYGDYSLISSAKNDFKNATGDLDAEGKYIETPNKGYYKGGTGEYRYHGYDYNNNLYANGDFPIDANSGMKATAKNWIYRIWDKSLPYYSNNRIFEASTYNNIAMGVITTGVTTADRIGVQKWINEGLPFQIINSNNGNKDAFNYAHVLTAPTSRQTGEVQMYHLSAYDGKPWYQIFSLNTIKSKTITPVDAGLNIVNENRTLEGGVNYKVDVTGKILDDDFYLDDVLKTTRYTREDISSWSFELTELNTGIKQTLVGNRISKDKGKATFSVNIPYSVIEPLITKDNPEFTPSFLGKATAIFNTGDKSSDTATLSFAIEIEIIDDRKPLAISIDAPQEMLDTEKFHVVDNTTGDDFTRSVILDGIELDTVEADEFLNGEHLFPLVGEDRLYTYTISYYDNVNEIQHDYIDYVLVYTTKPNVNATVTGTFKENRLITASPNINGVNTAYLKANASISATVFNATLGSGNNSILKFGTKNLSTMEFIVKGEDQVNISIQAKTTPNRIERSDIPSDYFYSEPYLYQLYTLPDYEPAMIANIWNGTLTRNESLDFTYEAVSTDQDMININTYKIDYDSDNNGTFETTVVSGNWSSYTAYKPSKLGKYKITFYAEESFGQPTLSQFITADDIRSFTLEREFNVDNLAPMTKLFTDIEFDFPQADVIVLNDQSITRELNNSIVSERVNWINSLRQASIDASVQVWDLFTYVYSQSASTSYNSGGTYPTSTRTYSSGGYSGTLSRYQVTNNQYQVDNGYSKTVIDSFTATDSASQSGFVPQGSSGTPSTIPSSISYNSGGYTGTLSQDSYSYDSDGVYDAQGKYLGYNFSRYATYSGVVSKSTSVWVSVWNWYDDYTGYYSGTIYKNVKQAFTPTFRINSDKYLVYFADSTVNNLTDIQAIKNLGTVKLILVGKASSKASVSYDYYIDSANSLETIFSKVNEIIANNNPYENKQLVQVGESFTIQKADLDDENDPIIALGYQYVQDVNYYDNSMGLESGAVSTYSDGSYTSTLKSSFSKVGHYKIFRKIKDSPVDNSSYSKDSNVPQLDIYVHRKPIADFTLDWDYSSATASYKTTWVDKSYDLDHQYSDPDKGIVDRRIMYRKTSGDNIWVYAIPDNLTAGNYELRYTVKDIEGAWSDEKIFTFTLATAPSIQLSSELKSLDPKFSLISLPASESVQFFNTWSRYPYGVRLETALFNTSGTRVDALKSTAFVQGSTGTKSGNDITWNNINYQVASTVPDGIYNMRITAFDTSNSGVFKYINFPVTIKTPINLDSNLTTLVGSETNVIYATTSIYANQVSVEVFRGKPQAQTLAMTLDTNDGTTKTWKVSFTGPNSATLAEGTYIARFTGRTPNGNVEILDKNFALQHLKISSSNIWGDWNHWDGSIDKITGQILQINPHRFMSHENIHIEATVVGSPDRVEVTMSPELTNYVYTNSKGTVYRHDVDFGYPIRTFPMTMSSSNGTDYSIQYVLPLADWTLDYSNVRRKAAYTITITAYKGAMSTSSTTTVELTGNIHDLTYYQFEK